MWATRAASAAFLRQPSPRCSAARPALQLRQQRRCFSAGAAPLLPVLARASMYGEALAVVSESGEYTYDELVSDSAHLADVIRSAGPKGEGTQAPNTA